MDTTALTELLERFGHEPFFSKRNKIKHQRREEQRIQVAIKFWG